mmetsp:Transcript_31402/g.31890  ORF Transcript_31402/g.31890 Transcript_31402/m.31890 type:complete len:86 (+) Transcript_31402:149-406(+)
MTVVVVVSFYHLSIRKERRYRTEDRELYTAIVRFSTYGVCFCTYGYACVLRPYMIIYIYNIYIYILQYETNEENKKEGRNKRKEK